MGPICSPFMQERHKEKLGCLNHKQYSENQDLLLNFQPLNILAQLQRYSLRFGQARILDIPISDYMPTIFDFNSIDRDILAGGEPPLDGLIFYTGSKMDESTGAGVFCPNPILKHSYKLNGNCSGFQAEIQKHSRVNDYICRQPDGPKSYQVKRLKIEIHS